MITCDNMKRRKKRAKKAQPMLAVRLIARCSEGEKAAFYAACSDHGANASEILRRLAASYVRNGRVLG